MAKPNDVKDALSKNSEMKPVVNTLATLVNSVSVKKRFEDVLGKKAPAFISNMLSVCNSKASLKNADPMSIISSAMIAATLDLSINPNLGFAHIVPYGGKAQFQMGWKGFVQLAMRSAQYKTIIVEKVYEGELVEINRFKGIMEFDPERKVSDKVVGYMAYFKLLNGFEKSAYITKESALAHGKRYSKSFSTGNWTSDPDSMGLKTVIKLLLSKFGILSIEMQKAVETDQAAIKEDGTPEYLDNPNTVDVDYDDTKIPKGKDGKEIPFGE